MFELIVRVVLASGIMASAGILGKPDFNVAWQAALLFASYSYVAYLMEAKSSRNAGMSGLIAVADAGVIAALLANAGLSMTLSGLTVIPMAYATFRFKANAAMMAPLIASWLLIGANLFGGGNAFTPMLLVNALGVLVVGLGLGWARARYDARQLAKDREENVLDYEDDENLVLPTIPLRFQPAEPAAPSDALKDSFRELSARTRELERRSRGASSAVKLYESVTSNPNTPYLAIVEAAKEISGARATTLYTIANSGETLIARSATGVSGATAASSFRLSKNDSEATIQQQVERALSSISTPERGRAVGSIVLKVKGRITGLLALFHRDQAALQESMTKVSETADFLSSIVSEQIDKDDQQRRLREAELLYAVATTTSGAHTPKTLANRVVRELWDTVDLDHLAISLIEDGEQVAVAQKGIEKDFLQHFSFGEGTGFAGWQQTGAPEVCALNAREDNRLSKNEALRQRIGSFVLIPLQFGEQPFGFVIAMTNRVNGIDEGALETLRIVCAELSQAFARLTNGHRDAEGLATPREFFEIVRSHKHGFMVYLDVPRKDDLISTYGGPAVEHAIRKFAFTIKSRLPSGSAMCRRAEGDYVVFLQTEDEEFATSWANGAAATASMVPVMSPDGQTRIPLALRAKVAAVHQQNHQLSTPKVA